MHPARAATLAADKKSSGLRSHRTTEWRLVLAILCVFTVGAIPAHAGTFTVFGPKNYVRGTGAPVTVTDRFTVLNPNTQYNLRVTNSRTTLEEEKDRGEPRVRNEDQDKDRDRNQGRDDDEEGVSKAIIILNGVRVVDPDDFRGKVTVLNVAIKLSVSNQVGVKVLGKKGGTITVEIVGVDNDLPTVQAIVSPKPNAAGWNNTNVTVTFTCSDATSGVASCPPPQTVITEGANQIISGTATDNAGNTASTKVNLNIDKTPPTITATASPAPNANGWNNADVTVSFTCSDATSGVATCSSPQTVTTEGANQSIQGSVVDNAGNTATVRAILNIDKTPPILSITAPANGAVVNLPSVTVSGTATDLLSGLASVSCGGIPATVTGSNFTCVVPIVQGPNSIVVKDADIAGNTGQTIFLVQGGIPIILSASPNIGQQGQQNLSVSITGEFTHFAQGASAVSFGSDITVNGVTVASATALTANITIAASASVGAHSVTITTATELAQLTNGFSVEPGTPAILSVDPNSGSPGQQTLGTVGSIFLTGHDPDFHAFAGPNTAGAADINKAAINFITNPGFNTFAARGIHKFLYATSSISPPGGHVDGTNGLVASGYVLGTDFDRADASTLVGALGQLGTQYDALVVASDFGGILTQAELDVLNAHSADLINFLNQGGGVYAMAEPTPALGGLASSGFFGFLPFAVSSTPLAASESGNSLTSFGVTLGLTNADINGNFLHNIFASTGGLNIVDVDPGGEILSLAGRGKVTPGGTGSVIITGQFTHFIQGTTQVSFGPGITVGAVTVVDASHLIVQITIDPNAISGGRTVTVTTGNEVAALSDGFTVLGAPQLLTISPNAGQQGQTNLAVTLIGQNTHFAQGVTTVDLGPGISVGPVTVTDATHLTAQVTIDPAAAVGARTVTVTTGAEIASLPNSFLVTGLVSNPTITSVIPNSGQQGQQNLSVTIAGLNTHFVQGTTTASFGTGITVASLTVNSATSATAVLNIGPAAVVGARSVTLTTSTEVVTLANAFTVQVIPNQPPVVSAGPAQTITLPNAAKLNGAVTDDGLPVGGILTIAWSSVSGPGTVSFSNPNAPVTTASFSIPGIYVLRLTANDSQLTTSADVTITINMADLLVGDLSDNSIKRYDGITGAFLGDFVAPAAGGLSGPTYYTFGPDGNLYVGSINTGSIKRYNGITGVYIDDFVPTGSGGGIEPYAAVFGPDRNLYVSSGYIPSSGVGGDVKKFNGVTGAFMEEFVPYLSGDLEYAQGILFGPDGNLYVCNQSSVTNTAAIKRYNGATGAFMGDFVPLSVTTDPVDLKFGPDGDLYVSLFYGHTIERYNGTTGADLGAFVPSGTGGLTWVPDLAFGPNGDLYTVERYAHAVKEFNGATGQYVGDIVSSASTQNGGLGESFALLWMIRPPNTVLTQASPNNGQQGQQNLSVALTGLNTHFGQGVTTATFGSGITVVSVTVNSATSTTVLLNIDPSAVIGARDVTLATGAEVVTLSSGFAVTAGTGTGTPILAQVNPNSGRQGQQNLSVAITGQNTHFSQGTTTASFGSAITVASLTVNSATSATAILNIDPGAAVGPRTVTVTTGTEVAALSGGFLIVTGNQPPVVSASAGCSQTIAILPDLITVSEYPATTTPAGLQGIAVGTDCNLWFTEAGGNKIGRITTSGVVTEFPIPTGGSQPEPITAGPDGNLWFGEGLGNKIGRISTAGAITEFSIPTGGSQFRFGSSEPRGITAGPDGNLWFTEFAGNKIGRITTAGLIAEFAISTGGSLTNGIVGSAPYGITPGPDGNLWFVEAAGNNVGRITPGGVITEFPIPTAGSVPLGITADPDGNLWFTESAGNKVGRITTGGVITEFPIPTSNATPIRITAGPDGNLWFTEITGDKVGRITSAGLITEYSTPTSVSVPEAITAGPDGNMWFTENATNVGKINPFTGIAFATLTGSVADDGLPVGATLTATWSAIGAPGTVLFGNPTVTFPNVAGKANPVATSATFSVPGTYTLSLTGSDSQLSSSSSVTITVNPSQTATTILSVNPNTGSQGQANLSVAITGQNTHFSQGTTTASFGAGITVGQVTVTDATHLTAQVTIDLAAAVGARTVTAASGNEVAALANGFLVMASSVSPTITSVSPNSGQQGQQNLSVTITGQLTHFMQGTTTASLGAGITVTSLTVSSATSATAAVNIDPAGTVGPRDVTVTTGAETAILSNGFLVTAGSGAPALTKVNPNSGQQGQQNLSVALAGQFTNFVQGTTQASFGDGISVGGAATGGFGSVTVTGPTAATAVLNISNRPSWSQLNTGAAAPVNRHYYSLVYDQTGNQVVLFGGMDFASASRHNDVWRLSNANGVGASAWTQVAPSGPSPSLRAGSSAVYDPGSDSMILFAGFFGNTAPCTNEVWVLSNASSRNSNASWSQLTVAGTSPAPRWANTAVYDPGTNRMIVMGGNDCFSGVFSDVWILSNANGLGGAPSWTQLSPSGAGPGARNYASAVYDAPNNRMILYGGGSGPGDVWILTNANGVGGTPAWSQLSPAGVSPVQIDVTASAYDGMSNRMLIFGGGCNDSSVWILTGANGLGAQPGWTKLGPFDALPAARYTIPSGANAYDSVNDRLIVFGGLETNFYPSPALDYGDTWVLSSAIRSASVGSRTVTVRTGTETVALASGFSVLPSTTAPSAMLEPACGPIGSSVSVSITGDNTNFVQGTTLGNFGSGVSVGGGTAGSFGPITVTSPTSATAQLNIDPAAPRSVQNVVLRTGAVDVLPANGFFVGNVTNPLLLSVTPNSGQQGQQTLSVAISGLNTHFSQSTTQVSLGSGITTGTITVTSLTSLTVAVSIANNANLGFRTVSVTTGTEIASSANGFTVTAAGASITTVSPNFGQQGQGGPVTIVGQNTHFVQGTTQVDIGAGITVSGITVSCPTCLNVQLQVAPMATPGPRTVIVTTGTEVAILTNGFTVLPGTPILTSLVPAGGQQGQSLSVTITGQYTHFTQGTTQVNLGAGITVSNINATSPALLTAQLTIDPAAPVGTTTLTVTTGTEVVSVPNIFTVRQATPVLLTLNPGGGQQGQSNLSVAITGLNTHFVQGTSQITFGTGVIVTALTVSSPTTATAVVNIDPAAALGPRTVTVTTNAEIASFPNGFTVTSGAAALISVNPNTGQQGQQNLSIALTGQLTHFAQGTTTANFGAGVTVIFLTVTSATSATAVVSIVPAATPGLRDVTLTTGAEIVVLQGGFAVNGSPALLAATPNTGRQGQQNLSVGMTGQFTHFAQGVTTASFGAGITVVSLSVNSPTSVTVVLNIDLAAAAGARNVTVTTGAEVVTLTSGFTITNGTAVLTQISPNAGQQGQQNLPLTITGAFTHFAQGTTVASFGAGVSVASATVNSTTSATVVLNIDPVAIPGIRDVTLTTGAEVVTLTGAFTVTPGTPVLQQVSPNGGQQGQQNLSVIISGTFTHFLQGTTTANFGAGITVASLTVGSSTSATAVLDINPAAALGARNVSLSTGPEVVMLGSGFTVVQASSGPTILSLSPNSALQGQSIQVTITAQNTHFVQGTTQVNFGPQISVGVGPSGGYGPVQVTSPTTGIAQISVPNNAVLGLRTAVARTGSEQADIVNGFATTGAPYISSLSPNHAQPGQTISVTIIGVFTNFQQGVTQATLGTGISIGGAASGGPGPVTVTSSSTATAQITIDSAATPGLRSPITVTTGAEQATFVNSGFLVLGPVTAPGPVVTITTPTEGSEVIAPTMVTGTVTSPNLSNWTLEYEASGSTIFTQFAAGTASTVSGTLDPTLLLNGIAQIRLTGVDQSGQTTSAIVDVVVARNTKVGNFTLSFNDLTIPVAGIPIQIIRTYDSRNKSSGDFGFGWSLDIQTTKVDVNGALGNNWNGTTTGGAFPTYCVQPTKNYVVSVRAPGGTVYQFAPILNGGCQQLAPPSTVDMAFTPIGATPQNASLAAANSTSLFVSASFPGQAQLVDLSTSLPYDPDQLTLTLPTGQQLQVSRTFGVQSIKDTNGNSLTITANGITSSAGKGVSFARDAQKRITTITDPSGKILTYAYDANGDLATFTDQLSNVSTFTYDGSHNLLSFKDPRGIQPIRNVYDDSGRLIQQIDAFSHVINYTHDLGARTETVTDFLGNPTTYVYDADGNIISTTDALGNVTAATFDVNDNKLSETNALGKISTYTYDANNNRLTETDPLTHTTTYSYNPRNQVLTITDALSRVTTNAYDPNGNLLSTKDPAGNSTSYAYNGQGLRISMTDDMGGISGYQYDSSGNLTQQTDPLGNVTSHTYDGNGNRLTQTKTRTTASGPETLITSYQYDAQDRLTTTTYPGGTTTQIQYNAIGKQSVTTDQLGRQTSYQYDLMGRLIQTTVPDGTTETSAYDAQGNRIASTDRAGRTTAFVYDVLKRLTGTTYADGATTSTAYDGIGEVTAITDTRGNQTKYQYDAAGRRTSVTDALSHATSFAYDSVGNQLSMTDANRNTTQYQYDALNRRTKTVYQDTTSDSIAYDALGRTLNKTDQASQVTQFQYDKLGRLTQVTDALSQVTKYAYDEVGDRISQTDANTHITTFAYDKLGRRTKRTLPLGMSESFSYDAAGNLVSKIDFNGKTTSYSYDSLNRLTAKTPDGSFGAPPINFAYTSTGQRQTMTDASGNASYAYDLRDRLTQKATPQGTLSYTYDSAGNLISIQSSNVDGTSVAYAYDALNRLSTVQDNRSGAATTTYSYDNVGNLQGYAYPNGVQTAYSYNTLNRLTNVAISKGPVLASYAYLLGPAGNRTQVNELSGRQLSYSYDSLYRLTGETISGSTINGVIGFQYDPVGNRLQRTSTVAPVPPASYSYDANDRLATDTYDADGNTTASGGNTYVYDFENRLLSQNSAAVTIVYDGDGNRVAKTTGGVTTRYLVDDRNLTGYAQVLEETVGGAVQRVYTYGLNRISQSQASGTSFYGYDGHGNVRLLTDATGAVTDRYDYDAFGNIISEVGNTPNVYLYSGEQNDQTLGFYYLRARYLNPVTGRFATVDSFEASIGDPLTLHLYLYSSADPIDRIDPDGSTSFSDVVIESALTNILNTSGSSWLSASIAHLFRGGCGQDATADECFNLLQQAESYIGNSKYPTNLQLRTNSDIRLGEFDPDFLSIFDCSGLVCSVLQIPATDVLGISTTPGLRRISPSERRAGDIVVFTSTIHHHIGFYKPPDHIVSATLHGGATPQGGVTDKPISVFLPFNGSPTEYLRVTVPCP